MWCQCDDCYTHVGGVLCLSYIVFWPTVSYYHTTCSFTLCGCALCRIVFGFSVLSGMVDPICMVPLLSQGLVSPVNTSRASTCINEHRSWRHGQGYLGSDPYRRRCLSTLVTQGWSCWKLGSLCRRRRPLGSGWWPSHRFVADGRGSSYVLPTNSPGSQIYCLYDW